MIDRAHGQVIRHQNQFFYERRHDIPIDLSSRFPPDVIKVSRCYRHQSLNNQVELSSIHFFENYFI